MTADETYPFLARFANAGASGWNEELIEKRRETRRALDEIERLRAENAKLRAAAIAPVNVGELHVTLPPADSFAKTEQIAESVRAAIAIKLDEDAGR
jgi:hypothetical protein